MPLHSHWLTRRASLLAIGALAAGLGCLPPAIAAAHGRARLESAVSEEAPIVPRPPAGEPPATEPPAAEPPATEPPTGTGAPGKSSRRARHEARRARRNDLGGECSLDLQATSAIVTAGTQLSLLGTLSCPEASSAAGQAVTLFQKLARTPGFNAATTTTTAADGTFRFTPEGLETNSIFYVRAGDARSDRVTVKVAPQVTIGAPAAGAQLLIGGAHAAHASVEGASAVTFTGTVSPADSGATVSLQREYRSGAWHRIGGGARVDDEGRYSIVHAFSRPGQASIRVVVHSHGLEETSASAPVTYQISRDRHRLLTIQASTDPLLFGQAVTITGTVAGAVNQPVTLLAQTGDHAFVPVAEATANGSEYSFTQSPQLNTRYRVRTASASSAVLSEGVSFALAQDTSASSVPAGAQLIFTGTVLPAHEGQPVELERRDPSGLGYHVIAVGAVSSSAYSIAHTFSAAGPELLRINVPGNTELQGVAGEPLALDVTPAS